MQVRLNISKKANCLKPHSGRFPFSNNNKKKKIIQKQVYQFFLIIENVVHFDGAQVLMALPRNKQKQTGLQHHLRMSQHAPGFKPEFQNKLSVHCNPPTPRMRCQREASFCVNKNAKKANCSLNSSESLWNINYLTNLPSKACG